MRAVCSLKPRSRYPRCNVRSRSCGIRCAVRAARLAKGRPSFGSDSSKSALISSTILSTSSTSFFDSRPPCCSFLPGASGWRPCHFGASSSSSPSATTARGRLRSFIWIWFRGSAGETLAVSPTDSGLARPPAQSRARAWAKSTSPMYVTAFTVFTTPASISFSSNSSSCARKFSPCTRAATAHGWRGREASAAAAAVREGGRRGAPS